MLSLWPSKTSSLLGLDIGSSTIKLLELSKQGAGCAVTAFACVPMPEGAVDGRTIKDQDAVADTVRQALSECGSRCRQVAIAVPDASVITKTIQLEEGLTDQEAEELVILEADKYIPYPIDEVSIDHQFMGPSAKGGSLQDVLVVASRTENINARVDLLSGCGLEVAVVDVESFAVERACQLFEADDLEGSKPQTFALFDLGDAYTQLTVIHEERTVFSREELFGGKQLTEDIAKRYNMSLVEADKAKRDGSLPDDYEEEVLQPYREMAALQVRRALQFFFSTSQHTTVDQIYMAGGAASIPHFVDALQKALEVPTSLVNPMARMTFSRSVNKEQISRIASSLVIVSGLAMRKFEL